MYRCARVQGLDTSEGLLLFGKEHFYVIDGYTMTVSREIRDIDTLPTKYAQVSSAAVKTLMNCFKWWIQGYRFWRSVIPWIKGDIILLETAVGACAAWDDVILLLQNTLTLERCCIVPHKIKCIKDIISRPRLWVRPQNNQLFISLISLLVFQFAWSHNPQRSTTRTESVEENLQHLCLWRYQGGAQEAIPAAGHYALPVFHLGIYLQRFKCRMWTAVLFSLSPIFFYCLSAHCSGSFLSGRQELFVSLPERSPQQSLPKVPNANTNVASGCSICV